MFRFFPFFYFLLINERVTLIIVTYFYRSRGKDSEYENVDSDIEAASNGAVAMVKGKNRSESEQREIDDFEKEERRILSEESQVRC